MNRERNKVRIVKVRIRGSGNDESWFEVAIVTRFFAIGNMLLGHYEAETPKWRRVLKVVSVLALTAAMSTQFGRPCRSFLSGRWLPSDYASTLRGCRRTA